jgi:serine/threonine-protein kinase
VVVAASVVFMVALANRNNYSPSSAPATSSTTEPFPSNSYSASAPSSTWATPTVSVPPPLVQAPDSYGESCPNGYHLTNQSGWATNSGRGTDQTSCQFANNVLMAYWNSYSSPSRDSRQVIVGSSVRCPSVRANASVAVQCSGDNFVITCAVYGNDPWITCTGGNNARVYLY